MCTYQKQSKYCVIFLSGAINFIETKELVTSTTMLKTSLLEVLRPLPQLFNLSLSADVVPEKKIAKVILFYKKANSALFLFIS